MNLAQNLSDNLSHNKDINIGQITEMINSDEFSNIFNQVSTAVNNSGLMNDTTLKNAFENQDLNSMVSSCMSSVNNILPAVVDTIGNTFKASDIKIGIDITINEAYSGVRKKISVKRQSVNSDKTDFIIDKKKLIINIPPGVVNQHVIKVDSEGDCKSLTDKSRSNVLITININNNTPFIRKDNNLFLYKNVTIDSLNNHKIFNLTHLNDEEYSLQISDSYIVKDRLTGIIKNMGMPINEDSEEVSFGDLIILFNISSSDDLYIKSDSIHPVDYYIENCKSSDIKELI